MSKNHPLVSIVTPTYNQAEFISETIESVLAQDYPNVEFLVLDDGSTDSTPDVLTKFNNSIRWERHENMGQAQTLNKGWRMCRGEYIGYISSDDRLLPHCVSVLVAAIERRPDIAVVYGDFNRIDEQGKVIARGVQTADFDPREVYENLTCHPGPAAIFRRSLFEELGGWNARLRFIPDFEFWLRAARVGTFLRVPEVVADYRVHNESGSIVPIAYEHSMEIVHTMNEYWGADRSPSARISLARAHHKSACSHAQSGRLGAAMAQFVEACKLRPRILVSRSLWRPFLRAMWVGLDRKIRAGDVRTVG